MRALSMPRLAALMLALAVPAALTAQQQGPPTAVLVRGPEAGRRAPDFSLPWATMDSIGGEPFSLSRALGRVVVLAFYPRDFTRTCTAEWQGLAAEQESLVGADVLVVGISTDSVETHQRFAASLSLPYMLLSDSGQQVARKYGAAGDDGVNRRALYVIGKDGRVRWRDTQFNAIDPKEYEALRRAVAEARQRGGTSVLGLAAITATAVGAARIAAQGQGEPWRFNGLRNGYCIEFLVDSAKIRGLLPDGSLPLRADRMQALHPAIARTIQEQPQYGSWTPASACFYLFDEVVVAGRAMPASKAAGELIGFVSYAARLLEDQGRGGDVLEALVASNWKGMRSADEEGLTLQRSSVLLEELPNSTNRRVTVKVGGTTLRWEGHDASDSSAAGPPLQRRWLVKGADRRYRLLTMRVTPTSRRSMIGSLIVQGDDDVAKALRGSPIRFVGPNYRGGGGELVNEVAH